MSGAIPGMMMIDFVNLVEQLNSWRAMKNA